MDRRSVLLRILVPVLVAAVAAGVMLAALAGRDDRPPADQPVVTPSTPASPTAPSSDAWFPLADCLPPRGNVDRTDLVVAVPGSATGPAEVRVDALREPGPPVTTTIAAGGVATLPVTPPTAAVQVATVDTDVDPVVHQVSRFPRGPAGTVAGPCPTTLVDDVVFPGMTTADGTQATITLANPSDREIVASIELLTPDGPELPGYSQVVPLAPGAATVFFVTDIAPDLADLGVRVRVADGAFAAAAMAARPGGDEVTGRTWVPAPDGPSPAWVVPWVVTAGDPAAGLADAGQEVAGPVEGWLWIANPGDTAATVDVDLVTSDGLRPLAAPVGPVAPGSVVRVDVGPEVDGITGDVGARVTADPGVVVGSGGEVRSGADRGGIVAGAGVPEPGSSWVVSGPAGPDRRQLLTVANPDDTAATVDVTMVTDVDGPVSSGTTVPAGSTATVELPPTGDATTVTVFVEAPDGAVTTQLRSALTGSGPMDVVAVQAAPAAE
ncbi:DUF5719 family protein [Salsipaludibacter albus]|uniref:DUF5719 family protein n=1 Tax=Salsipaludibacter albus TaxID=2849650 RepID=UPI001EE3FE56|nr:DUF5719 family protein [Salsipaludibacter albus]MBY5161937.1 hypothetical protein [Salsipaludibacter albus]